MGTIKINDKKYYRIGKNKYNLISNLKKVKPRPISEQEPQDEPIVRRSAPVYNKKGKKIYRGHRKFRHLLKAKKGDFYVILGTKKLKNKKFYEVQKIFFESIRCKINI